MNFQELEEEIDPFYLSEYDGSYSVCLNTGDYKNEIFEARYEEGFLGNGYDWQSLAVVFINEKMPELEEKIEFDSEAGLFCAYSNDKSVMEQFAIAFKTACEDDVLIKDLFSRAELD